jgi:hypothetical protein
MLVRLDLNRFEKLVRGYALGVDFSYEALEFIYNNITEEDRKSGKESIISISSILLEYNEFDSVDEVLERYGLKSVSELKEKTFFKRLSTNGCVIKLF